MARRAIIRGQTAIEVEIPQDIKMLGFANERFIEDPFPHDEAPHKGYIHLVIAYKSPEGVGVLFPGELTSATNPVTVPSELLAAANS